jgi:hypothetical protein
VIVMDEKVEEKSRKITSSSYRSRKRAKPNARAEEAESLDANLSDTDGANVGDLISMGDGREDSEGGNSESYEGSGSRNGDSESSSSRNHSSDTAIRSRAALDDFRQFDTFLQKPHSAEQEQEPEQDMEQESEQDPDELIREQNAEKSVSESGADGEIDEDALIAMSQSQSQRMCESSKAPSSVKAAMGDAPLQEYCTGAHTVVLSLISLLPTDQVELTDTLIICFVTLSIRLLLQL